MISAGVAGSQYSLPAKSSCCDMDFDGARHARAVGSCRTFCDVLHVSLITKAPGIQWSASGKHGVLLCMTRRACHVLVCCSRGHWRGQRRRHLGRKGHIKCGRKTSLLGEFPCRHVRFCVHHLDNLGRAGKNEPTSTDNCCQKTKRAAATMPGSDAVKSRSGVRRSPRVGSVSGRYGPGCEGGVRRLYRGPWQLGRASTKQGM
jgi:hypothetical protein